MVKEMYLQTINEINKNPLEPNFIKNTFGKSFVDLPKGHFVCLFETTTYHKLSDRINVHMLVSKLFGIELEIVCINMMKSSTPSALVTFNGRLISMAKVKETINSVIYSTYLTNYLYNGIGCTYNYITNKPIYGITEDNLFQGFICDEKYLGFTEKDGKIIPGKNLSKEFSYLKENNLTDVTTENEYILDIEIMTLEAYKRSKEFIKMMNNFQFKN